MKAANMSFKSEALRAVRKPVPKTDPTLKGGTTSKPLDPGQLKNLERLEKKRRWELAQQLEIRKEKIAKEREERQQAKRKQVEKLAKLIQQADNS